MNMGTFFTRNVSLSAEESRDLLLNLRNPNDEILMLRDEFFNDIDSSISIRSDGTGFVVDAPDLDLSFLEESDCVTATVKKDEPSNYYYLLNSLSGINEGCINYSFISWEESYNCSKRTKDMKSESDSLCDYAA